MDAMRSSEKGKVGKMERARETENQSSRRVGICGQRISRGKGERVVRNLKFYRQDCGSNELDLRIN